MTTVSDILHYLDTLAPRELAEPWDNVGLLCGSPNTPVTKVLLALDPFEGVCREAGAIGAELIVTHHPLIFTPLASITDQSSIGRSLQYLCSHGISAINAHTNLDCAAGGVNDCLAARLGLETVQTIPLPGKDWGLLRYGAVPEQPLTVFLEAVKTALGCPGLRYVDGGEPVHQVAVGGGSCGSELMDAVQAGCDTFVTSDVKYNQFWDAKDLGLNLIDAGHFHTENPVIFRLAERIQSQFPNVSVRVSQTHRDCVLFF